MPKGLSIKITKKGGPAAGLLILSVFSLYSVAGANPVFGEMIVLTQPDGTEVVAYIYGDEYHLRVETQEGYTILLNEKTGWIEYADLVGDSLVPTGLRVGYMLPAQLRMLGISKHLSDRKFKVEALRKTRPEIFHDLAIALEREVSAQPLTGTKKVFVVCVEFQPESSPPTKWSTGAYPPAGFNAHVFSASPGTPSMTNFYKANSYNQFWPEGYTFPQWITLPRTATSYKDGGSWRLIIEHALDGIRAGDPTFDFTRYANNNELDLFLIWAGTTQTWASFYWPHAGGGGVSKYGITVRRYSAVNERLTSGAERTDFGVYCHEYGHMTGSPDLYDYSSFFNRPVGVYCIMGVSTPKTHFCGYLKWKIYGWVGAEALVNTGNFLVDALSLPSGANPKLYKIDIEAPKEYFLLENRDGRTDPEYEAYPGRRNGLLITHVDENYPPAVCLPTYTFYGVEAVAATLNPTITTLSQYAPNWYTMAFSSEYGFDRLENSYPDDKPPGAYLQLTTGDDTENVIYRNTQGHKKAREIAVLNIGRTGPTMSFRARILGPPLNFSGRKVLNSSLLQKEYINVLTWESNSLNENVVKYRVYRVEGTSHTLVGEVDAGKRQFLHRKVNEFMSYSYVLVAVNDKNREGQPAAAAVS